MTPTNHFNYDLYQHAVAIFSYAERVVCYPNDFAQIDYCRNQAAASLVYCHENKITWMTNAQTCKGKRLAGRIAITVETGADTSYGFSYYPELADKIAAILRDMWLKSIHGLEINQILDPSILAY